MPGDLTTEQGIYLLILFTAIAVLLTERVRNDIVAILIIVSLYVSGILTAEESLAGFSSEPAIVVAGIFVLSRGMHQTGLSETIGGWVSRLAGSGYNRMLSVVMLAVAGLSAFTHHLTTTAVMLPVTMNIAQEREIAPSKLLMPLSFAASLGTTITIIGAPAFLLASSSLQRAGRPGLGIFSIAPIGIALTITGTVFMLLVGRLLLPDRKGGNNGSEHTKLEEYLTELAVLPGSPLAGKTIDEAEASRRFDFEVDRVLRDGQAIVAEPAHEQLREGDVLVVRTTPDEIATVHDEGNLELAPIARYEAVLPPADEHNGDEAASQMIQAIVAPEASLIGQTLREARFRRRYGAVVVSISRRGEKLTNELRQIPLRSGDVLVIQGDEEAIARVASDRDFLLLMPFQAETRRRQKAPVAAAIMLATIAAAALNLLSIEIAAITGAVAMVLTGCLSAPQAYRAIDARIYVFIAGAIPLGAAMEASGTSDLIAGWMQSTVAGWNQMLILLTIFGIVAVLTQFMSDAATTAIFAPVAIALANALGQAPEPFVVTVAMAAVASFLTPIGHHGNLLVYAPGRYQFADFVKVGTPLTVVVAVVVVVMAPILW